VFQYPATAPLLNLTGTDDFEQLGHSIDLTKRKDYGIVLAVASVGKEVKLNDKKLAYSLHRAGQVQLHSIQIGANSSTTLLSTLKSDRAYASFGSKVQVIIHFGNSIFRLVIMTSVFFSISSIAAPTISSRTCILRRLSVLTAFC
jgi:hypothetical protein